MLKLSLNSTIVKWADPNFAVFLSEHTVVSAELWCRLVNSAMVFCRQQQGETVLLTQKDSLAFSVWFCALSHLQKHIVLPPNEQQDTLLQALQLCDWQVPEGLPELIFAASADCQVELNHQSKISFFTSGSTGEPKLISKALAQLLIEVENLQWHFSSMIKADAVVASTVPHHHIYGLLFRILWPLLSGRSVYQTPVSYIEQLAELLNHYPVLLIASPAHLSRFGELNLLTDKAYAVDSIFSSGGPLADHLPVVYQQAISVTPIEIFGSTETGGIAYRQRFDGTGRWQAFRGIELQADAEHCLAIRSPYLLSEHWFQTQDRVKLSDDRQFELLGRADRVVKIEEKRLSLPELEAHAMQHFAVLQAVAAVLSLAKPQLVLLVQLTESGLSMLQSEGRLSMAQQLKTHLLKRFDAVLMPKKIRYVETLPYNEQGKLPLKVLESFFADE